MRHLLGLWLLLALVGAPGGAAAQSAADDLAALRANAERGNAASQYALGLRYANGAGVERDPAEALRWYRLSGEQGHVPAQFAVGAMYDRGIGVAENPAEAVRWYTAAALQGHASAQHNLGVAYETGRGVLRDDGLARGWYQQAADLGLPASMIRLAEMFEAGRGGPQDMATAAGWYQVAAVQGVAVAQARLGLMFAEGRGIDRNDRAAYTWLSIVQRRVPADQEIAAAAEAVAARLDPDVRAEALDHAESCALAAFHYCGYPIAPPCTLTNDHRAAALVLEQGTYPDVVRPQLLQGVQPQYPVDAVRLLGRPGDVVLDVLLLADGRVGPICVRQSLGPAIDAEAVRATSLWQFAPATRNGEGVPAWVRVELSVREAPAQP